jgi:cbb3-type cytochrome oxidase maturation protein
MSVLYVVVPLAIVMAAIALIAFFWAVHKGQYDDLETPPSRMLVDDEMGKKKRGEEKISN